MCGLVVFRGRLQDIEDFEQHFLSLIHRGPDNSQIIEDLGVVFAFHRLSIMDVSAHGHQPFVDQRQMNMSMCNGEIYNFSQLEEEVREKSDYSFHSHSDCEVILPIYAMYGLKGTVERLDGEFASVIWDHEAQKLLAFRDPIGIRPLFYGYNKIDNSIMFASEMKVLHELCNEIKAFPPGHYYDGENFHAYINIAKGTHFKHKDLTKIFKNLQEKLINAVDKRLHADVNLGFLLSGGLDSSLVCAIAHRLMPNEKLKTFAIGMNENPIDLKYAKIVADYINSEHHEVIMTKKDVLAVVKEVIWHLESWDVTTIRASIGMFLCCRYIHENTDVKALLTGEVSDELFGYKYTDYAPSADEFQKESEKRIQELYMYDVLRADRCIAGNSLEARVPFSDKDFVEYVMNIKPSLKMNTYKVGKYLLRKAFDDNTNWLPESILYREKAAFSDAVGHSMVDYLKEEAEKLYTDDDLRNAKEKYPFAPPYSKEALWYRDCFEDFYPGRANLISDFWMPNKSWPNCNVSDPSARVLDNYGQSGF
ncbi:MAG: asparagine synthase (glutamine-hydrolyzing) [Legionellales bacterium RIFCSPHIGHO2_12_FULL_37_14]|nr:MAG: asparagine synthase (glutamine-hydrolyzing) [Legionellales bacterium RIFCSPHIGHO2_12_FULL_37_14]